MADALSIVALPGNFIGAQVLQYCLVLRRLLSANLCRDGVTLVNINAMSVS